MSDTTSPINEELLAILRCPLAIQEGKAEQGQLTLMHNSWLVCEATQMKYPIRDGIPVMLIDEGKKWQNTAAEQLPVPPPAQ